MQVRLEKQDENKSCFFFLFSFFFFNSLRVFEARHVEDQHLVFRLVVRGKRAEMSITGLLQALATIRNHHSLDSIPAQNKQQ